MKQFLVLLALACAVVAMPSIEYLNSNEFAQQFETEEQLRDFIGDIINSTLNGAISKMSDPMTIADIHMDQNSEALAGTIDIKDIAISGIHKIVSTAVSTNLITQQLNISVLVPDLTINFGAAVNVVVLELVPLYGSGKQNINIGDVKLSINAVADLSKIPKIQVSKVDVVLNVGSITFNLNGLLDNPEFTALVNTLLNDNVAKFIDEHGNFLMPIIDDAIKTLINSLFA
ncbi:uncharacterized protein LOC114324303 [Diabrotica virgifera virgifera]|uniref:Uncharacterized protein LOC114324303 n=1 Tax=Diabrotica virgifera virgifera TaxID=50390 RepID=A0A6P7F324_DIAVI|nr:uncharacterized protein LOC114324303 [Diabrotica virgifera virgifera]